MAKAASAASAGIEVESEGAVAGDQAADLVEEALAEGAKEAHVVAAKIAKPAIESPRVRAPRVSVAGGVTRSSGPGRGAAILLVVGAVLLGATVFSVCYKKNPQRMAVVRNDAAGLVTAPADANEYRGGDVDGSAVATAPSDAGRPDAGQVASVRRDAGAGSRDGGAVAVLVDAGVDKYAQAKALYEKAHAALEDGDPEQALELLEQSLALRPRALTYLEQARALQRMGRIDDAIAAVDRAIDANKTYAPAYEQKGMILWSAQRYDEARPALEKYLEIDPNGRRAETIKSMLAEPK